MKKRAISIAFSIAVVCSCLCFLVFSTSAQSAESITIGSLELPSGSYLATGATQISSEKPESEGYAYYKDGVLILKDFVFESSSHLGIYCSSDLTLRIIGNNKVSVTDEEADSASLTVDGNLLVVKGLTEDGAFEVGGGEFGINSRNLTVEGGTLKSNGAQIAIHAGKIEIKGGTLDLTSPWVGIVSGGDTVVSGGNISIHSKMDIGIVSNKNMTVSGGNIKIKSEGTGADGYGIYAEQKITIEGGNINVEAKSPALHSLIGITVKGGEITSNTALYSGQSNNVSIDGGTINADINGSMRNVYITGATVNAGFIMTDELVIIKDSVINAESIFGYEVQISSSLVTVKSENPGTRGLIFGLSGFSSLDITASESVSGEPAVEFNIADMTSYKYIRIGGHSHSDNLTRVSAFPASCTQRGNIEYYKCICGKYFEDEAALNEIADKESVYVIKNHIASDVTEKVDAVHTPTELKAGMEAYYTCTECGLYFDEYGVLTTSGDLVIPAPTHSYGTAWNYKGEDGHSHACSCGAREEVIPHVENIPAPTETQDQKCRDCGYVIESKLGHVHKNHLTKIDEKPVSCSADGNIEYYKCACGKYFEDENAAVEIIDRASVKIPATHVYGEEWVYDTEGHFKECTCKQRSEFDAHSDNDGNGECDVCTYIYPTETEPVPTEPIPTEPVPTEPVPTEPVPTEPVPTEPVPTTPDATSPDGTTPDVMAPDATSPDGTVPSGTENKEDTEDSFALVLWILISVTGVVAGSTVTFIILKRK